MISKDHIEIHKVLLVVHAGDLHERALQGTGRLAQSAGGDWLKCGSKGPGGVAWHSMALRLKRKSTAATTPWARA